MKTALLIFPHQLFEFHPGFESDFDKIVLTEDPLFFGDVHYQIKFHKQKIALHRASMKGYESFLISQNCQVDYRDYVKKESVLKEVLTTLAADGFTKIIVADVHDFMLQKRLLRYTEANDIAIEWCVTPQFLNTVGENKEFRGSKNRWFMADFYKWQRQRLDILMEGDLPVGGKWSFDEENRKKLPKKEIVNLPTIEWASENEFTKAAIDYVESNFSDYFGSLENFIYPTTHSQAQLFLNNFCVQRFELFGPYEDAIVEDQNWLYHSVLTPMLNTGLLTPKQVIDTTLKHAQENNVPIASVEGFVRQIIGWREFMRATYVDLGVEMRTTNHWNHTRKIPRSFYDGTTGIVPVDNAIKRILETGYCHHIERLMVLGGFMFLCEFDPDEIYKWFMELFIDSYDWVMVPNVYAMSQNADGGNITTKPYFSGSNYVCKMSHYKKAEWAEIWDGLYWAWILDHADELRKNPRWSMMVRMGEKMDAAKKQTHQSNAKKFLSSL